MRYAALSDLWEREGNLLQRERQPIIIESINVKS
jgi:hypothetical protein